MGRTGDIWEPINPSYFYREKYVSYWHSCATKWDDENIIITGGWKDGVSTNETWIMNVQTNTIKPGPNLKTARRNHSCVWMRNDSIIVAGGLSDDYLNSSEILKIGDLRWTNGPDLKDSVFDDTIVMSIQKHYIAYSYGGKDRNGYTTEIYGFNEDRNEWQV